VQSGDTAVALYNGTTVTPTQTLSYDGDGNLAREVDGNGDVTTTSYDPLGRRVAQTNPVSGTTIMTYTATEKVSAQDIVGNVTSYTYDQAGRLVQANQPLTGTMQYGYDAVGNTTAMTTSDRASGNAVTLQGMAYDALNHAITDTVVTNTATGLGGPTLTTATRYDQDGNVSRVQHPNGDVTYDTYDATDQLSTVELDSAVTATAPKYESYSYDLVGNTVTHVDADNRTTTTTYDPDNRMVRSVDVSVPPTGTTTITTTIGYDPNGNAVSQTTQTADGSGTMQTHTKQATFDANDWQTSTNDDGLSTAYGYDAAGQPRTETIMDGVTPVTTQLDAAGRATSISESAGGGGPYTSGFGYNANNEVVTMTMPGGVGETAGYNANSQLTNRVAVGPSMGTVTTTLNTTYAYGYNAAGWTTSTTTISGTDAITHDGAGRIIDEAGPQVDNPTHAYHWAYDNNGNVTSQTTDGGGTQANSYSQAQPNELVQTYSASYANPYTYYGYDGNGDTTSITSPVSGSLTAPGAINTHVVYDAEARPVQVTRRYQNTPITATLSYNADGDRSRYIVAMSGTAIVDERFQYRDGAIGQVTVMTATLTASGTVKSTGRYVDTYIYNQDGTPLELLRAQNGTTNRYWYVLDGRDNVVAVTDGAGKVVDRYNYDSWGESIGTDYETVPQQLRYAGYWWDGELQWYWLSVRYYDPEDLHFLQPDPSEQDGVHTYAYVGDYPLDATDPTGLSLGYQPLKDHRQWLTCTTGIKLHRGYCPSGISDPINVIFSANSSGGDGNQAAFNVLSDPNSDSPDAWQWVPIAPPAGAVRSGEEVAHGRF